MKNIKSKSFLAIGILAFGVLASNLYTNAKAENIEQEKQAVASCEVLVSQVQKSINNPLKKGDLNTSEGLHVAATQNQIQQQLENLKPQNVNCNIKELRNKFINDVHKINNSTPSIRTPG